MFKYKIEKMPLCIDCKNCYSVKSKLSNDVEAKCDTYCQYNKKMVNIDNYIDKCKYYEKQDEENNDQKSEIEIDIDKFKKLYRDKEEGTNIIIN